MPLSNPTRNQIVAQLDAAFNALEAGDAVVLAGLIHQSFEFTLSGRRYIVQTSGSEAGSVDYSMLVVRIKRMPL